MPELNCPEQPMPWAETFLPIFGYRKVVGNSLHCTGPDKADSLG